MLVDFIIQSKHQKTISFDFSQRMKEKRSMQKVSMKARLRPFLYRKGRNRVMSHRALYNKLSLALFLWVFGMMHGNAAFAEPTQYVHNISSAGTVTVAYFQPSYQGEHTFETKILNATGDTYIHVMESNGAGGWVEVASNDDCQTNITNLGYPSNYCPCIGSNCNRRSKLTIHLSDTTNQYQIVVRSYFGVGANYPGNADLVVIEPSNASSMLLSNASFDSPYVEVNNPNNPGFNSGQTYVYQTASAVGKKADPILYGIECGTSKMVGISDDDGPIYHAKFSASNICYILTARYVGAGHGYNDADYLLYVNDVLIVDSSGSRDSDGDGLGLKLEEYLLLCDRRSQGTYCSHVFANGTQQVFNLKDTDGDGLSDDLEIFGKDGFYNNPSGTSPNYQTLDLPRLGAHPRIKDIFLEFDYTQSSGGNPPFTKDYATKFASFFNNVPPEHFNALTIAGTLQLHFDMGIEPSTTDPNYNELVTLYGDWGGSNQIPASTAADVPDSHDIRKGVFRTVNWNNTRTNEKCYGHVPNPLPNDFLYMYVSPTSVCDKTFVHELGHALGIYHWGHDKWGRINGKANYVSIMNYAHDSDHFSGQTNPMTINPSQLDETVGLGTGFDPTFLQPYPYFLQTGIYSPIGTTPIDWNRNGSLSDSGIRYPVTLSKEAANFGHSGQTLFSLSPSAEVVSSPKLLLFHPTQDAPSGSIARMYVFYVEGERIKYRHAKVLPVPNSQSSCPNGDTNLVRMMDANGNTPAGGKCMTWSSNPIVVDVGDVPDPNNPGLMIPRKIKHVTAISIHSPAFFQNIGSAADEKNQIMLAFVDEQGTLFTQISQKVNSTESSWSGLSSGEISWSSTQTQLDTNVLKDPELIFSEVNGLDVPTKVSAFYIKAVGATATSGIYTQKTTSDLNTWGSGISVVDTSSTTRIGDIAPTVTWWPDISHPNRMMCAVFPEMAAVGSLIKIFCRTPTTGPWTDITQQAFGEIALRTFSKVSLVYRYQRLTDGTPVDEGNAVGQWWLFRTNSSTLGLRGPISQEMSVLNPPTSFTQSNSIFKPYQPSIGQQTMGLRYLLWDYNTPETHLHVFHHLKLSALQAAGLFASGGETHLRLYPVFDGTSNTPLSTGSDFQIMERGICLGLQDASFCGTVNQRRWKY